MATAQGGYGGKGGDSTSDNMGKGGEAYINSQGMGIIRQLGINFDVIGTVNGKNGGYYANGNTAYTGDGSQKAENMPSTT